MKTFDTGRGSKEGSLAQNHLDGGHSERHGDVATTLRIAQELRDEGIVVGDVLHLPRHSNRVLLGGLLQAQYDALRLPRPFGVRQCASHRSHHILPPLLVARRKA